MAMLWCRVVLCVDTWAGQCQAELMPPSPMDLLSRLLCILVIGSDPTVISVDLTMTPLIHRDSTDTLRPSVTLLLFVVTQFRPTMTAVICCNFTGSLCDLTGPRGSCICRCVPLCGREEVHTGAGAEGTTACFYPGVQ